MKPYKGEPGCIIVWFGLVISPLVCMVNGIIGEFLVWRTFGSFHSLIPAMVYYCFGASILTGPLTLATLSISEPWNRGHYSKARWLSGGIGLFAVIGWLWFGVSQEGRLADFALGVLLLPFLWSLMFLIFALFARPPKP